MCIFSIFFVFRIVGSGIKRTPWKCKINHVSGSAGILLVLLNNLLSSPLYTVSRKGELGKGVVNESSFVDNYLKKIFAGITDQKR